MPISVLSAGRVAEKGATRKGSTLFSRMCRVSSLEAAFQRVARNRDSTGGVDDVSVAMFKEDASERLRALRNVLRRGAFKFSRLRTVAIEKKGGAGYRPILVPTVTDRIVQRAILHQISGPLEPHVSHKHSHAFQSFAGVRRAVHQLRDEIRSGKSVVLVVDIEKFFPSIDEARLFDELIAALPDDSLSPLLRDLQRWEMNDLKSIPSHKRGCFPEAGKGVPQGSALSPLLSNFFLRNLDQDGERAGITAIRYADDIAVPCMTNDEALAALGWLQSQMEALKLTIHPLGHKKTHIYDLNRSQKKGLEYLGFYLWVDRRGVNIKPTNSSVANAKNEITETFESASPYTLSERYVRHSYFLNSWLSTYGKVCPVKRERAALLAHAEKCLSALLRDRGLLKRGAELSRLQRQFLGVESIFAKAATKTRSISPQRKTPRTTGMTLKEA